MAGGAEVAAGRVMELGVGEGGGVVCLLQNGWRHLPKTYGSTWSLFQDAHRCNRWVSQTSLLLLSLQ